MADNNGQYKPPELDAPSASDANTSFGAANPITAEAISVNDIQSLPDRPSAPSQYGGNSYSAKDLKERFEGLARLAINAINKLIAQLRADTVSECIKIPEWGGTGENSNTLKALVEAVQTGDLAKSIKVDTVQDVGDTDVDSEEFSNLQAVLTCLTTYVDALETAKGDGTLAKKIAVDKVSPMPHLGKSDDQEVIGNLQSVLTYLTDYLSHLVESAENGIFASILGIPKIDESGVISTLKNLAASINGDENTYLSDYLVVPGTGANSKEARSLSKLINELLEFKENHPATVYIPGGSVKELPPLESIKIPGTVFSVDTEDGEDYVYNGKTYPSGTNFVLIEPNEGGRYWDPIGGIINYNHLNETLAKEMKVTSYSGKKTLQDVLDVLSTPWDLIITDPTDLASKLASATGNVLVSLARNYFEVVEVTLSRDLKLLDFGYLTAPGLALTATGNTVIKNLRTDRSLENFTSVENCQGVFSRISVKSCQTVKNSEIFYAENCTYVHQCICSGNPSAKIKDCTCVRDILFDYSGYYDDASDVVSIEFENCAHISNVRCVTNEYNAEIIKINYKNCTFVAPYTCAGYVSSENSGKVPVPDDKGGVEFKEFVPRLYSNNGMVNVYIEDSEKGLRLASASPKALEYNFVYRTKNGQLNAPTQTVDNPPGEDQYVSNRYLKEILANAGTQIYKHRMSIGASDSLGNFLIVVHFTIYNQSSRSICWEDIVGDWDCEGMEYDYFGEATAHIKQLSVYDNGLHVDGVYLNGNAYRRSIERDGTEYIITIDDNVTEVI